ncbi:NAD(P)/FAD-dependent oxidoreductase [Undibacterium terreum]|uniref:FAD-dependent oxidoreductase n=1 Tax=Undibacterium terreum TaxID=1224302 RepID=A0A916V032_9BURK|nr:FAD-binding oxidoreductase [Undibacterium terreum]GGC95482.1 FAD-dependent oxidoreductase [Undibacterium terreum]
MQEKQVIIVGGGVIGSAIAYFLAVHPRFKGSITVIERDASYAQASSALSASSIRQQFSTPVNIAMSQFGISFLRELPQHLGVDGQVPDLGLSEQGYLYLATVSGQQVLRDNHAIQRQHGVDAALLEPHALQARFPWLDTADLALASLGLSGEGWFDGYGLLMAFRHKARSLGVRYISAHAATFIHSGNRVQGIRLEDGSELRCDWAVNAAGAWARPLLADTGFDMPVHGRRRCVFVFSSPAQTPACPLVIDPSGLWFRPEGAYWICGMPPAQDDDDVALDVDYREFDQAWPLLAQRVPGFDALRLQRAWAGYYEYNSFDQNAILGPHPLLPNLLLANGFSGHGLQHSPAVGRGLAEWIADGSYASLDLSPLSVQRLLDGRPLLERNII